MNLFAHSRKRLNSAPYYMVFVWFGGMILGGTILLWLPFTHVSDDVAVDISAAFFTTVSAACVTGLSVVNIGETFAFPGQLVIFFLMEMSGMGIVTFATLGFRILGRRLSLTQQAAAADAIYQNDAAGEFKLTFMQILKVSAAIQVIGFALMLVALAPRYWHGGVEDRLYMIWAAAFHAVSAFCNCGFSIFPDLFDSLRGNYLFLGTLLALVLLGGIGHMVLNELYHLPRYIRTHLRKPHWLSVHARVALVATLFITVAGTAALWWFGTGPGGGDLWLSLFEIVNARTAGFNIEPQAPLPLPTAILVMLIMFIGGSPGSCAGGVKTTSVAIWVARIRTNLRNDTNVNLFGYTIVPELVSRARILMALATLWNLFGLFILAVIHPGEDMVTLLFEQISAFGTVGLSMEFTARLTDLSRLWICMTMIVGRLGPLSLALWIMPVTRAKIGHPEVRIMVG